MEDLKNDDLELDHYFVMAKVQISVGPSVGECSAPHSMVPHERTFVQKYTKTVNRQFTLGVTASATPAATPSASYGESGQKELSGALLEVKELPSGSGPQQSYC